MMIHAAAKKKSQFCITYLCIIDKLACIRYLISLFLRSLPIYKSANSTKIDTGLIFFSWWPHGSSWPFNLGVNDVYGLAITCVIATVLLYSSTFNLHPLPFLFEISSIYCAMIFVHIVAYL